MTPPRAFILEDLTIKPYFISVYCTAATEGQTGEGVGEAENAARRTSIVPQGPKEVHRLGRCHQCLPDRGCLERRWQGTLHLGHLRECKGLSTSNGRVQLQFVLNLAGS